MDTKMVGNTNSRSARAKNCGRFWSAVGHAFGNRYATDERRALPKKGEHYTGKSDLSHTSELMMNKMDGLIICDESDILREILFGLDVSFSFFL